MKINTILINIANNSIDQRSRSYDNSEVSQDHLKWHLYTDSEKSPEGDVRTIVRKESAKHVSAITVGRAQPLNQWLLRLDAK